MTLTLDNGRLVEGVVDLAFEESHGWTAVDYKTDRELAGSEDEYRRQLTIYARGIAAATGRPVTGALVRV